MSSLFIQIAYAVIIVVTIAIIASVKVGALWLRMALIALLITMLAHRIDRIGAYFGLDIISQGVTDVITLLTLAIILFAFIAAYMRKPYLLRAEKERQFDLRAKYSHTIEFLERMREKDQAQVGYDWGVIPKPKNPELMVHRQTDSV